MRLSEGIDLFAPKFYHLNRFVPINHSWLRKLETWATRWWRPHPSAFPHFDTILEYDRQTDSRCCKA